MWVKFSQNSRYSHPQETTSLVTLTSCHDARGGKRYTLCGDTLVHHRKAGQRSEVRNGTHMSPLPVVSLTSTIKNRNQICLDIEIPIEDSTNLTRSISLDILGTGTSHFNLQATSILYFIQLVQTIANYF